MPTIKFSLKDLEGLLGRKISVDELGRLLSFCKAELEDYDKKNDEASAALSDTNLPYLWSVEGIARIMKGVIGKEKGIPCINIKKSGYKVAVDDSVLGIRPYIVAFAAKGKKINDCLIKQIIQLQEKLCESFGRRRQKIAIGMYKLSNIKFPVYYKATDPESVKFIPLDSKQPMTQREIIERHPKGKEYSWILKRAKKYPLIVDSEGNVLSFPPIINSAETGKICAGDDELFFEATGTDLNALNLAANIFANALHDRGFDIMDAEIKYKNKTIRTPEFKTERVKFDDKGVFSVLGLDLNNSEIKKLLEKMRYNVSGNIVEIPSYRKDILHNVDLIEDIAIAYGYDKIKGIPLEEYSAGRTFAITKFIDSIREAMIGQGYQEILSPILSSKEMMCGKMNINDFAAVEIENPMSDTFSAVRSWIMPVLIDVMSKNKHVDYPHRIFEHGIATVKKGGIAIDYEKLAVASAHSNANFTEIKQVFDYLMRLLGINYNIKEISHGSFIEGRSAAISVNGKGVACIGEINPAVLHNFGLEMPVAAFELNLSGLFEEVNKR